MSDAPAKAARKPTACEKVATMIEFPIGEQLTEEGHPKAQCTQYHKNQVK
jgi:hypothetical protein